MIHNRIGFHIGSHSLHSLWESKKLFKKISLQNVFFFKKIVWKQPVRNKAPVWVLEERALKDACF